MGFFFLLLIIFTIQCIYFFADISIKHSASHNEDITIFQREIDSLKQVQSKTNNPKIFIFNPNFISDYKGYNLGMSSEQIDRLLNFRKQGKWINSISQFQEVTKVSDSLLSIISPYFKFPDWVTNPKPQLRDYKTRKIKTFSQKIDLNIADAKMLQRVNGIGEILSERIIRYRNKFDGGFIADVQLQDIYGISIEVKERLLNDFTVKTPREINKFNLNNVTVDQLVTIQHIDYEIAHEIINERTLRDGFISITELRKVKDFPVDKLEIIQLYLMID